MSRLTDLIAQVKDRDPQMGLDLESEFKALSKRRAFGLNFERHKPEEVELPGRPIRRGDKVRILPERGTTGPGDQRLWIVTRTERVNGKRVAHLRLPGEQNPEEQVALVDDLVVVAAFGDAIYPGLVETGRVERGDADAPFHTVINAENYHALRTLTYTHRGKIDCIYIDPPYNTGDKSWKYNNNYVEGDDLYRHSKWLAFMERRLRIARELLSESGVLVATIDEHEVNRLGLLLEQTFPEFHQQLVTIVNNPKGVTQGYLSRVEEYAFFLFSPSATLFSVDDDLLTHRDAPSTTDGLQRPRWKGLLRSGDESLRADRKDMFYPVWLDARNRKLVKAGDPLPLGQEPSFDSVDGLTPIWPIRKDGQQGRWGVGPQTLNGLIEQGFAAAGRFDKRRKTWAVSYLSQQVRDDLDGGLLSIVGYDERGVADVAYVDAASRRVRTVWHRSSHDAGAHGTDLLRSLLGAGRPFPFPKSLYAVEDALRPLVGGNKSAVILDFFSGSGTTAHAVMRLNREDGGSRQCISVTNNEVAAKEQVALRESGLRPGDEGWEALGICDLVTKPRLSAAITGTTPQGAPVPGDYKFASEFPMSDGFAANARFFTLTYETPISVSHNRAYARIAPLLWLRAGAQGREISTLPEAGWEIADTYALLHDLDTEGAFLEALEQAQGLRIAYIVTDDAGRFESASSRLPEGIEPVRLYESYLTNLAFLSGD
ncbi:site-specific DNA-methyltransferase [Enemella evansiae]|uniref:site-specific DNA-methyltransferase n=1 Tax=Enemella evansiae TaxID=2016499 RepID=UPI000B96DD23|nr:DNA methyltransferase [Enemella evansiae]OYO13120.1 site-specific DNA-methyltransferase [Enemella evansiae]